MNQTYVDREAYKWEGSYAFSSIVGGFLHLKVARISFPKDKGLAKKIYRFC
jgi:hypothetical protein